MKTLQVGDKSKAVCEPCNRLRHTTFRLRDLPTSKGKIVRDVLVAVCDQCDRVVAIPHQSIAQLNEAI